MEEKRNQIHFVSSFFFFVSFAHVMIELGGINVGNKHSGTGVQQTKYIRI